MNMKRVLALALAAFLAAGFAAAAAPAGAQEYDRYERGTAAPPPPSPPPAKPRSAPPPPPRPVGFHGGQYLSANIGLFEPNDYQEGLWQYDSGWSGNIVIGSRLSPFGAIEGGVGYYTVSAGSNDVSVVPVTIGGRLIIPHPVFELYFGGGIGAYFASMSEPAFTPPFNYIGTDDSDTTIGGYFSIGLDMWINPKAAINIESRYQMADPSFTRNDGISFDVDVSGWELNVGFRFNF
jgi:opacity protein-like surface antigen